MCILTLKLVREYYILLMLKMKRFMTESLPSWIWQIKMLCKQKKVNLLRDVERFRELRGGNENLIRSGCFREIGGHRKQFCLQKSTPERSWEKRGSYWSISWKLNFELFIFILMMSFFFHLTSVCEVSVGWVRGCRMCVACLVDWQVQSLQTWYFWLWKRINI